jgi:hypothetical protein
MRAANAVDHQRQQGGTDDDDEDCDAEHPGGAGARIGPERDEPGVGHGEDGCEDVRNRIENRHESAPGVAG